MANQQHREIVRDALKCEELAYSLVEVCSVDDNCEVDDYSDLDILSEAVYVHDKFLAGNGFIHYDELVSSDPETRKIAKRQFGQVKRFLKKWLPKVEGEPNPMGCTAPN